jgi:hypothetical protein
MVRAAWLPFAVCVLGCGSLLGLPDDVGFGRDAAVEAAVTDASDASSDVVEEPSSPADAADAPDADIPDAPPSDDADACACLDICCTQGLSCVSPKESCCVPSGMPCLASWVCCTLTNACVDGVCP